MPLFRRQALCHCLVRAKHRGWKMHQKVPTMIESIFTRQSIRSRHLDAPCLKERELYLKYLQASGVNWKRLQKIATNLFHIIRVMQLTQMRTVDEAEIREAAFKWASEPRWQRACRGTKSSADTFRYRARQWMRFHNCLKTPERHPHWFDGFLEDFRHPA